MAQHARANRTKAELLFTRFIRWPDDGSDLLWIDALERGAALAQPNPDWVRALALGAVALAEAPRELMFADSRLLRDVMGARPSPHPGAVLRSLLPLFADWGSAERAYGDAHAFVEAVLWAHIFDGGPAGADDDPAEEDDDVRPGAVR